MIALVANDLRVITRSAAWPLALGLHVAAAAAFVAAWGPTGGVPLWSAPLLSQLVAADRLLLALLLTWLVTPLFAPRADADVVGWSAVSGVSVTRIIASRAIAAVVLSLVMVAAALPVAVAAANISAVAWPALGAAILAMSGFAVLTVGLTAAASVACRDPLGVWVSAMSMTGVAAVGVRFLTPGATRVSVCVLVAVAGMIAAAMTAARRWAWISEAEA